MRINPPKWAQQFLHWYCNPELLEEIEGDIYELFERRAPESPRYAKRRFIWDVLRFFRWSNIKRSKTKIYTNNNAMISNYFKTGIRNIIKDKATSAINIVGLSLAIGCAITTYIFVDYMLNQDSYHSSRENIYQVINHVDDNGSDAMWSDAPILLGDALKENISFVDKMARVEYGSGNLRYEDLVFNESLWFSDPEILEMFDFPIASGNKKALYEKNKIFLSRNLVLKYFGQDPAVGKQMSIKYSNGTIQSYFVGGVFDKWPSRTSFAPSVLVPIDNFYDLRTKELDWSYLTDGIFVSLKPGHSGHELNEFFPQWIQKQNDSDPEFKTISFEPIVFSELPAMNYKISSSVVGGGHPAGMIGLSVLSAFLILLACSNYVNIAVSSSTKRLKEIAMRKVMGGTRASVIRQFLIENVLICFLAVVLGVAISYFFFLPGFNSLIPIEMPFEFSSAVQVSFFFVVLLLFIGLVSGAYPALYISKFNPVNIFRGTQKFGRKSLFSKILLIFQFVIAFSTVVGSFIFTDASIQLVERDWGYKAKDVVAIPIDNEQQYTGLFNELSQNEYVVDVTAGFGHIWAYDRLTTIKIGETTIQSHMYETKGNYADVLELELIDGRFLEDNSDIQKAVINERMAINMNWKDPLSQHFYYDSVRFDVIGVVRNFINETPYSEPYPAFFVSAKEKDFNYVVVKAKEGMGDEVYELSQNAWKKIAPDDPYEGFYQAEVMDEFHKENKANIIIMTFVSGLALLLSCIGLYGLVSFNISRRMKEFSVRKVLGASLFSISKLINSDYIWLILIAFVIGAPLGYIQIIQLLKSIFPETPSISFGPYVLSIAIILGALLTTIAAQLIRVAKSNPAEKLRNE